MRSRPRVLTLFVVALGGCIGAPAVSPSAEDGTPRHAPPDVAEAVDAPPRSTAEQDGPRFVCTTSRHRVALSVTGNLARYRSWDVAASFDGPPALELSGAPPRTEGACGVRLWSFMNEGHGYTVREGRCDADGNPLRPGAQGLLTVAKDGETPLRQTCGPAGSVEQGGWTVAYRPGRATATPDGGSARILYADREDKGPDGTESREWFTLLSVVGPLVSVQREWYAEGGAHPTFGTTWSVIDARDPAARFDLRDLVPEATLLAALMADPTIRGAFRGAAPTTLAALFAGLDGGCAMDLGPHLTRQVAFAALDPAGMRVRLGISHGCEAERGTFTTLHLLLPPPPALLPGLQRGMADGTLLERLVPPE